MTDLQIKQLQLLKNNLNLPNPLKVTLGLTIYKSNFDFKYIFDLAEEFDIKYVNERLRQIS